MILEGIAIGLGLLFRLDPEIMGPIRVSVTVSTCATLVAATVGVPFGIWIGLARFPGRGLILGGLNTLLSLPTVLVGLVVYAMISRQGPLGELELLYTRGAMVAGQALLAWPMVAALTAAVVQRADPRISLTAMALGAGRLRAAVILAARHRVALLSTVMAAFGRVFSEVGISMMVGGNIRGVTRNVTTGIAFETGKGEFAMGVALGVVLLGVALVVNLVVTSFQLGGERP